MRDTVQCQGGLRLDASQSCCGPDEKLRKRLDLSDIPVFALPQISARRLQRGYNPDFQV